MLEEFILNVVFFIVSFSASIIGAICGIGGGIIIKPVLDAIGIMSVSAISFLSGCTVLSMSIISVYKNSKNNIISFKRSILLAVGAAVGGILGNILFQYLKLLFNNDNKVGAVQAFILIIITILTLIYIKNREKIETKNINNLYVVISIGLILGLTSSFLGIGGGPINIVILSYFFSMETKVAAANSLFIIMFSQITNFMSTLIIRSIPYFNIETLIVMVIGAVLGGGLGNKINRNISTKKLDTLFIYLMLIIISINLCNFFKFLI